MLAFLRSSLNFERSSSEAHLKKQVRRSNWKNGNLITFFGRCPFGMKRAALWMDSYLHKSQGKSGALGCSESQITELKVFQKLQVSR